MEATTGDKMSIQEEHQGTFPLARWTHVEEQFMEIGTILTPAPCIELDTE